MTIATSGWRSHAHGDCEGLVPWARMSGATMLTRQPGMQRPPLQLNRSSRASRTGDGRRRVARVLASALFLWAVVPVVGAGPASAHAVLTATVPRADEILAAAP